MECVVIMPVNTPVRPSLHCDPRALCSVEVTHRSVNIHKSAHMKMDSRYDLILNDVVCEDNKTILILSNSTFGMTMA